LTFIKTADCPLPVVGDSRHIVSAAFTRDDRDYLPSVLAGDLPTGHNREFVSAAIFVYPPPDLGVVSIAVVVKVVYSNSPNGGDRCVSESVGVKQKQVQIVRAYLIQRIVARR